MICRDCAYDADMQSESGWKVSELAGVKGHESCKGCTCQHKPAGSVSFLRKENGSAGSPVKKGQIVE